MSTNIELKILTDLTSEIPQSITSNYEEVKQWLSETLNPYKNLVITNGQIQDAKKLRARINKVSKAITSQRIAVKKHLLKPYTIFDKQCNELIQICDEITDNINTQLSAIENSQHEDKLNRLKDFYEQNIGDYKDYVTWEDLINPKWVNTYYTEATIKKEIADMIEKIKEDVHTIRAMKSEFEIEMLETYRNSKDIRLCLQKHTQLIERKKKETQKAQVPVQNNAEKFQVKFCVHGTKEQLLYLKNFLKENNMLYEQIN